MAMDMKNSPGGSGDLPARKKNPGQLWLTGLIGLVFWGVGELLFPKLTEDLYTPLGIAVYFLLFSLVLGAAYLALSVYKRKRNGIRKKSKEPRDYMLIVMAAAVLFAGAFAFEFIYELGRTQVSRPTSYIFLIDDSGSMGGNDPENQRVTAIEEIMQNDTEQLPYAVYRFDSAATLLRPMAPYVFGDPKLEGFTSQGGTEILGSLQAVVDDHKNGVLSGGANPRVLLLSDGGSTHFGLRRTVRACAANGISVGTIGFGSCDEDFLRKIASSTGGVYVYSENIADLKNSMQQALVQNAERDLLSERFPMPADWLYACMRILFLFLLSLVWAYYRLMLLEDPVLTEKQLLTFLVACGALAALAMEFLTMTALPTNIVRLVFCILWSLMPGGMLVYPPGNGGPGDGTEKDPLPGGDVFGDQTGGETKINRDEEGPAAPKSGAINFEKEPAGQEEVENPFAANPFDDTAGSNPFGGGSGSDPFEQDGGSGANPFGGGSDNPFA